MMQAGACTGLRASGYVDRGSFSWATRGPWPRRFQGGPLVGTWFSQNGFFRWALMRLDWPSYGLGFVVYVRPANNYIALLVHSRHRPVHSYFV
jgi:hypothetical protein